MNRQAYRVAPLLMALMTLGGCASMTDSYYEKTQSMRALTQYAKCGRPECSTYPRDYKRGWIDGFYEVATGGDSCPPAFAPERYYKPNAILKNCDNRRHAYYNGWQAGASRATQFPDTHYLRIYETSECPFPRCEKPCVSGACGACGPCGVTFAGMSASTDMIETMPVPAAPVMPLFPVMPAVPVMPVEDAFLPSTPIELVPKMNLRPAATWTAPVNPVSNADLDATFQASEGVTLQLNDKNVGLSGASLEHPEASDPNQTKARSKYRKVGVFVGSPAVTSSTEGFVRLAKSTQPNVATRSPNQDDVKHVVVVEAVDAQSGAQKSKPVVQLVK